MSTDAPTAPDQEQTEEQPESSEDRGQAPEVFLSEDGEGNPVTLIKD